MMATFAKRTDVAPDKTRGEIEKTLARYKATGFMYGWQQDKAMVAFEMFNRRIMFLLPMPAKTAREITHTPGGTLRSPSSQAEAYSQVERQRWRALLLSIKAKLEAVESGIATFEDEFLAHIMLPDGQTVGNWMRPQIGDAYQHRKMPPMLPGANTERT